jgi:hypothetical protein
MANSLTTITINISKPVEAKEKMQVQTFAFGNRNQQWNNEEMTI